MLDGNNCKWGEVSQGTGIELSSQESLTEKVTSHNLVKVAEWKRACRQGHLQKVFGGGDGSWAQGRRIVVGGAHVQVL